MKRILGILGLLVFICAITAICSDRFFTAYNIENVLRRSALFGILGIGAAFVIITGGIDLSIGSVVGLTGIALPLLVARFGLDAPLSLALGVFAILGCAGLLGAAHGFLITRLRLQPFVVTLCGLLIYRGAARGISGDQTVGFGAGSEGLRTLATGRVPLPWSDFGVPAPVLILAAIAIAASVFLNRTVWGRYLLALGNNEEAARLAGIDTRRMIVLAYVICAVLAAVGGMLFVLDVNSAQPADFGNFYELYAIAAAVLGGCSLRGGEGTIAGVVIGAMVMQALRNSITLLGIPTQLEFAIIGAVILLGVSADELVRRFLASRREHVRGEPSRRR